ncbi:PIR Superfamily Protein [Plasmodium ovale wallikeri]|uniref:PIR Superfamily Protein n=1 Tax=Plasmodium ovale wallikeri TaxID=864142 RepID=A0A1A9APR3_PLAOA|nr:PIR Superfamily Protein [Plasmodium ovale wallikeri]
MGIDDEEDEEENYIPGDNYYSTLSAFIKYEDEFNSITNGSSDTQEHNVNCTEISYVKFSSNDFTERCNKVARYLHYIKQKQDEDDGNRCRCLNYLLNTKTEYNIFSNKKCSELFVAYDEISAKLDKCKSTIGCIYKEDIQKIKKLYDLNKSMKKLEKSIADKDEHINVNAEDFSRHYRNAIIDCPTDNSEGYCAELKGFQQYIYHFTKPENYSKASDILKTLIPNDGTSSIIVPCIIILGIPFFLYILYKFTPLGSWAHIQFQKKKKMWNNLSENEYNLDIPRNDELNMENSKFNIKYHSA